MKNIKQLLIASLFLCTYSASAGIVILGKAKVGGSDNAGNTYIECKGNKGKCVTIADGNKIANVHLEDGTVKFAFTDYEQNEAEEGTRVTLFGAEQIEE